MDPAYEKYLGHVEEIELKAKHCPYCNTVAPWYFVEVTEDKIKIVGCRFCLNKK